MIKNTLIKQTVTYQLHLIKLLSFLIIVLIGAAFIVHINKPKPTFYSQLISSNQAKQIFSLEEPNVTTKGLLRWATFAITSIYTLDFVHYEKTIEEIKEFFTEVGYQNYISDLDANNKLIDIAEQKLVVSAVLNGTPVIIDENILSGLYTWQVKIPLLVTYQGASEESTQESKMITALIIRDPKSPKGIGIAQIVEGAFSA